MKERGIIFTGHSVRAILDGRKTQTRRVVRAPRGFEMPSEPMTDTDLIELAAGSPYGVAGDRLWVRESWKPTGLSWDWPAKDTKIYGRFAYRADEEQLARDASIPWRSPLYMPRWVSRLSLEITAIRVERLQAITDDDALAEGAVVGEWIPGRITVRDRDTGKASRELGKVIDFTPRGAFCHQWDAINGKRAPWASNPWVWVIEFRRRPGI